MNLLKSLAAVSSITMISRVLGFVRDTIIARTFGAGMATEIGYQVGTRNIVDVLDAQRQLYNSVRDYNNSRYDYILDNLRLKQAAGTLNPGERKLASAALAKSGGRKSLSGL